VNWSSIVTDVTLVRIRCWALWKRWGFMSGRWRAKRIYKAIGNDDTEWWGVFDGLTNPDTPLLNWTKRGVRKFIWKGTEADAHSLAQMLNEGAPGSEKPLAPQLSQSQRIMYSNNVVTARKRNVGTQFKRCACGTMYKGDKHCD
jgi:hypothetical protein